MKKLNYRITVNINNKLMKLGFRAQLPKDRAGVKIRLQAIFTQRQVDRRFPMDVKIEESDIGPQIHGDAMIELPYVFLTPPRRNVNITFSLWFDTEEMILDDQPFPVQKEMFARADTVARRSRLKFAGLTAALPVLLAKSWLSLRNMDKAKKQVNEYVYKNSGISYSPRQRNTNYFADRYQKEVKRQSTLRGNEILFLSERSPVEEDNLQRIKRLFLADPSVNVSEFIHTETVDTLTRSKLEECAKKCARASVIILEDFYPQLHSLTIRPETTVVQLWHACGAFKTFGYSHMGKPGGAPQSSRNHRNYDFVSVSSEKIRGLYAEAFGIPFKKVQALGVPRTDDLFDWQYKKTRRQELGRRYPVLKDNKVILFAPTFRGEGNKDAYYPAEMFNVGHFMEEMPEDVALVIKQHPFADVSLPVPEKYADRVLDLSGEEYINDLMLISDLLITDYSSSIFEAAILELPMLFYAFDLDEYKADRDFYYDFENVVPGPVEKTFDGLIRSAKSILGEGEDEDLEDINQDDENESADHLADLPGKMERFREVFLSGLDGHSTERIYQYIRSHYIREQ